MSWDEAQDGRQSSGFGGRFYGVYPALVTDIQDPDGQGRVKVRLPWSPDTGEEEYEVWARLTTLMAGADRGSFFVPDPNDEVLISFAAGDPRHPFVMGALWNGQDDPPEKMDGAGDNFIKSITSRNGVRVGLDDKDGQENLKLETPGGQSVLLKDGPGGIEIVDSNGNSVKLGTAGIDVVTAGKVTVQASTVEVTASMLTVNAGMSKFSGVVQADTVITNSVVSTSYTPGAGNIW